MSPRVGVIIGILVAANLLLAGYITMVRSRQPATSPDAKPAEKILLPRIQLFDDRGQTFQSDQLLGTPLFVQFINPDVRQHIDVLSAILKIVLNKI